jgi:hypothetical protein
MGKKRKIAARVCKLLFSGTVSILLCSLFAFVFNFSPARVKNESGATEYRWKSNSHKITIEEGFAYIETDEDGFNDAYEAADDKVDILLMGSSHMEAYNVGAKKNTGYLLNGKLPEYTYNIGISGHQIWNCVENMEAAVREYRPAEYVVLETATIELSITEMQAVLDGTYTTKMTPDNKLIFYLKSVLPAACTIMKSLRNWEKMGSEDDSGVSEQDYTGEYAAILNAFLAKAAAPVTESGAKLIIFYHPPATIDESGNYADPTNPKARDLFQEACEANGILYVDMTEPFEKLYNEQHRLAHGFINTGVGVGHLNKYGHEVIADTLVSVINEDKRGVAADGTE